MPYLPVVKTRQTVGDLALSALGRGILALIIKGTKQST